jgi:hypothetical protein
MDGPDKRILQGHLNISPTETDVVGISVDMIRSNALRTSVPNDHVIELTGRDVFQTLPPNQSIAIVGGSRWRSWYGPFLAMAKAGTSLDPPYYQDISLVDYRDVVDYMSWFRDGIGSATDGIGANTHFARNVVLPNETGKLKGVRVNAYGDRYVCNRPLFEPVNVPCRHPLFSEADDPSPITEHLGSAAPKLYAETYSPNPFWKSNLALPDRFNNPVYDTLYLHLEPDSQHWGRCPEWRKNVKGSILLVDRRRKDLTVDTVNQLVLFAQDWLLPRLHRCGDDIASRNALLNLLTIDEFNKYTEGAADKDKEMGGV